VVTLVTESVEYSDRCFLAVTFHLISTTLHFITAKSLFHECSDRCFLAVAFHLISTTLHFITAKSLFQRSFLSLLRPIDVSVCLHAFSWWYGGFSDFK